MRSKELQIGKAGEHLVCADLILRGYPAFLADQGSGFDVVVDTGSLKRIQVKTTQRLVSYCKSVDVFRFYIREGRKARGNLMSDFDFVALVALSTKQIAYFKPSELRGVSGRIVQCLDLRTKKVRYSGRGYSNGTVRGRYGRFIEDHSEFKP